MKAAAVANLLEHPVYGMSQVDRLLGLTPGTARRWIDGYQRGGRMYPPVVRLEPSGDEIVTWGEFVETRLLAEYRDAGVPLLRMRPALDRLRERFDARYPLAHARPFLDVAGKELVYKVQDEVGLDEHLHIVVVRNDQLTLAAPADNFVRSADFSGSDGQVVTSFRPVTEIEEVVIDPLRQFGEPVVRSVRTEVIAEEMRAGETVERIAELYSLPTSTVEAALRYELFRGRDLVKAS